MGEAKLKSVKDINFEEFILTPCLLASASLWRYLGIKF